ncbi:SurA N-terminal domain-containing protein [Marinospirillum alkaliphilum]|uniref:Periplasmic chaperone PpiD n=1 Tax=Marinospirillum alkaliphilum DSM 21637 TaxID=1122209 RepID=A0A1K1U669_9GAMM|nr:SurA N-terminal domain-containing protein [Marinospirillum alkaliphilum]SFX07891.1 peptidyl-prolyl cis-trans isomerase D [Marinospirillum alkaliphilum DSM 21637]
MLVKIREKSRGIVAYFLVGLIAIAFSMWGMDSLFTAMRGDPNELARVNGESISQFQVDRMAQQQMRQLLQSGQIDPEQLDMNLLRQFSLNQLIQEELLRQKAADLNMRVSDRQVERQIVRMRAFQDENGRFQQETFTQLLRQEGLSPAAFRAQLHEDLVNQQLLGGLSDSEFVLASELTEFQLLVGQQRDYRYRVIAAEDFISQVRITDEALEAFYREQIARFMTPEQIRVDYLIFDPASLVAGMNVSEEELQQEYQRYADTLRSQSSSYSAAHILLTYSNNAEKQAATQRLQEARQEVLAGADFAELARDLSEDLATARRGGELGPVQPGSLNAAFETALFAMSEPGQVSEVVETEFGLHLIQLLAREDASVPPLNEVREELRSRLLAQPLRAATSDKLEQLRNLSFSSESLKEVAEASGIELHQSGWLVRETLPSFWAESAVREALFSRDVIEDGWITEPLRLQDGRYLVLARDAYQPRQQQPLEAVADEVREHLTQVQATKMAREAATTQLEQLQAGETLRGNWREITGATRNTQNAPRDINREAFRLSNNNTAGLVTLANGDTALVELQRVQQGEVSQDQAELAQLRRLLLEDRGYRLQAGFVKQLESEAKIELR